MTNLFWFLAVVGGLCFLFGIVYPLLAVIFYPLYKMFGGELDFGEYVRCL